MLSLSITYGIKFFRYINEGLVKIFPWNLRGMVSQKEIRTEGMFAALNDCLYRQMNKFKFVLFVDFDELVVPLKTKSLRDFAVSELKTSNGTSQNGSLVFRNAFFYLQWADDPDRLVVYINIILYDFHFVLKKGDVQKYYIISTRYLEA